MRWLSAVLCATMGLSGSGCASTVTRLDGEFATPAGRARDACERADWLVVAPTRAEVVEAGAKTAMPRDDGAALYRVGDKEPQSIIALGETLTHPPPRFDEHAEHVRKYDTKRIVAAGLGTAGVIAIGVGTALFISAFRSERVQNPDGTSDEEQRINGGRAATGGITVGLGLGLGIAGIAVNPSHAERSRAEAARYVFLPPTDSRDSVLDYAERHNQAVRERCEGDTDLSR